MRNMPLDFHAYGDMAWRAPFVVKAMAAFMLGTWGWNWWKARKEKRVLENAKRWPAHRARVISAQVLDDSENGHERNKWKGLLTYSYFIHETEIGEYVHRFQSEDEADEWARALRDKSIEVNVNPQTPAESRWLPETADAFRRSALQKIADEPALPLPAWIEAGRLALLLISVAGATLASWFEVLHLLPGYVDRKQGVVGYLLLAGGLVCPFLAATIFRQRYPKRSLETVAEKLTDPVVRTLIKVVGFAEGALALFFWGRGFLGHVSVGEHGDDMTWLLAEATGFLITAGTCWLAGPRQEARRQDLAPPASR